MPFSKYKMWAKGPAVGDGVTGAIYLGVSAVAKSASPKFPNLLVNEVVCSHLARVLMLPIPPGFVVEDGTESYFASLDFSLAGESLPPVNPKNLVSEHPSLAVGIVVFDSWVMNHDRHRRNLAFDKTSNKVQIFDHSHALLAGCVDIASTLTDYEGKLCIGNHCLAPHIYDGIELINWLGRLESIPDYYIREAVNGDNGGNLDLVDAGLLVDFLLRRRDNLRHIFESNLAKFPELPIDLKLVKVSSAPIATKPNSVATAPPAAKASQGNPK